MPKSTKNDVSLRIVNQYRDREKHGMVYEFRRGDDRLALLAAPSEGESEWRYEARTAQSPDVVVVGETRRTRAEALETLGRQWTSQVTTLGIPTFDWLVVTSALVAVRGV